MTTPPEPDRRFSGNEGDNNPPTFLPTLLNANPALLASVFLAAGIAAGRGLPVGRLDPPILGLIDSVAVSALFMLFFAALFLSSSFRRKLLFGMAFFVGVILIWRHDHPAIPQNDISRLIADSKAEVVLQVKAVETVKPYTVRYLAEVLRVAGSVATGEVWWYASKKRTDKRFLPGDTVTITNARLRSPRGFHNIGGWDFEKYLFNRNIGALVFLSQTSTVRLVADNYHWRRPIERIKSVMRKNLTFENNMVTAIGRATLTGDQGFLTPSMRRVFADTGLSHILAVSGLHVGFFAFFGYAMARALLFPVFYFARYRWASAGVPMTLAAIVALALAIGYGVLTGPRFPAYRATIMVGSYLVAVIFGKGRNFLGAFAAAFSIILVFDPWALFNAGFGLSFSAVFFIALFLERYYGAIDFKETKERGFISKLVSLFPNLSSAAIMSAAAFLGTAPLVAYYFNSLPAYSIPLNIIILPVVSFAIPLGILSSLLSAGLTENIIGPLLTLIASLAVTGANLPFSSLKIASISMTSAALCYFLVGLFLFMRPGAKRRGAVSVIFTILVITLVGPPVFARLDDRLTVRFLDIGQGDSIVAYWPQGALVIDGGKTFKTFDPGASIIAPVLWRAQRRKLSAIIATHGDNDHAGGLAGLAKSIPAEVIYDNGQILRPTELLAKLRALAVRQGAYSPLYAGDRFTFDGGVTIDVLNPPKDKAPYVDTINNRSLVLKITYKGVKILLAGDAGSDTEKWLIETGVDLSADVLKVAHHGGADATSAAFLKAVNANTTVITLGYKNKFGHPAKSTLKKIKNAGIKLYRTDLDGEVVMRTDGKSIEWETYQSSK